MTFRHMLYPAYKSNRTSTPDTIVQGMQYLKASIKAMSIKVIEVKSSSYIFGLKMLFVIFWYLATRQWLELRAMWAFLGFCTDSARSEISWYKFDIAKGWWIRYLLVYSGCYLLLTSFFFNMPGLFWRSVLSPLIKISSKFYHLLYVCWGFLHVVLGQCDCFLPSESVAGNV